jgi:hypothetical protein|tara:strand:+ start:1011 stop:1361 length:351 start_codon:yes stop_codon:yes gene_type:complete
MNWQNILKRTEKDDSVALINMLEKKVEEFLNNHIFDEDDYTEEKLAEMQRSIDDGNSLDGMGQLLDIKLELDPDEKAGGLYVNVNRKNGEDIVYFQMDIDGNFRREGKSFDRVAGV